MMMSVGSMRYGYEVEKMELEIEDGEAGFVINNDGGGDSIIDPDVSLSYIGEKIHDVLGDCQKDFEGGLTAENLGAKFGGYGSFLPTYQRSPVGPLPKTSLNVVTYSALVSPNTALIEVSHTSASQSSRNGSGPAPRGRPTTMNGRLKQEVSSDKSKSVSNFANDSDQKSLKVRIKVCSDNTSNRKNAEIYSGLGLDVSPSSSLEVSPVNSDGFFHGPWDGPDISPTSILEIMTSFPILGSLPLSPLPYEVLHLTEKKLEDSSSWPVHKGSQESTVTALYGSGSVKVDQIFEEKLKSAEKNSVSMESTNGDDVHNSIDNLAKKETSVDNFVPGNKTSSGGKNKSDGGLNNESFTSKTKNKDHGSKIGKIEETYKDFFGELNIEHEDHDEIALEKPSEGINVNSAIESNSSSKERSNGKKSQKPSSSTYARVGPHVPTMGDELGSDVAVSTVVPVVNEDWVCCDKCEKWRLLPPGVNPKSLPEKWLCSMLDWLPGMNWCSISEEETTKAIASRFPGPLVVQGSQPVHPSGPQSGVIPPDGTHQPFRLKKKHGLKDLSNELKQDRPSMSSNSSKKNFNTSYKTRSLNGVNQSFLGNEVEYQDSGHSYDVIVENDRLKKKENDKLRGNSADEGNNSHHPKIRKKRESSQDYPKDSKKVKSNDGTFHTGKSDKRDVTKKRKKLDELGGSGKNMKETSESSHRKENKARVLKSSDEGPYTSKSKNIEDIKLKNIDTVMAATSSSSKVSGSHKNRTSNREAKGSPVESVSSFPMRILKLNKYTSPGRNTKGGVFLTKNVDTRPCEEKSNGGRKNVKIDVTSSQDSKKPSKKDISIKEKSKSNSLPPRAQNEIERNENMGNNMSLKGSKQKKKGQNQNGNLSLNMKEPALDKHKQPAPDKHKVKTQDPTVVLVRDLSNRATTNALREATNLKHMADRVKNTGSSLESRALYIEAALKFLHVASLFETGISGDMVQSKSIYSSTAKLCEYCAHEYERTKETTTAALAYKCMEVAYMKVIYYSHATASKDVNELQVSLPLGPTGESPSSSASASDLDNLNNPATVDKAPLAKGVNTPQVVGNLVIASTNKPNYTRILNFAQEVNLAMEASRKSRIAFAASSSKAETVLSAIKKALDFNFHDVEGLLHLVRVAMEIINR